MAREMDLVVYNEGSYIEYEGRHYFRTGKTKQGTLMFRLSESGDEEVEIKSIELLIDTETKTIEAVGCDSNNIPSIIWDANRIGFAISGANLNKLREKLDKKYPKRDCN